MTEGNTKTIQKELKKVEVSLKKKRAYREAVLSSTALMEQILTTLLKEQVKDEKLGLGKLLGSASESKILPEELLTRLNKANDIRKKAAHGSSPIKKRDAEEVYFTLAELDKKANLGTVCNVCYKDWSRRGINLCVNCYGERKDIADTIKKIREKTNEKIKEIRDLHKIFSPVKVERENLHTQKQYLFSLEQDHRTCLKEGTVDDALMRAFDENGHPLSNAASILKMKDGYDIIDVPKKYGVSDTGTELKIYQKRFGIPLEEFEGSTPIKCVKYGKLVFGKPNVYYRQNKILDELHGKFKKKTIEELRADPWARTNLKYEVDRLFGIDLSIIDEENAPWTKPEYSELVNNPFFEKPKEEFKEVESLLNKNISKKLSYYDEEDMPRSNLSDPLLMDILIELEIFFLVSTYHRQLLAKATIARCEIERNTFLDGISVRTKEDFSKFLEEVSKLQ